MMVSLSASVRPRVAAIMRWSNVAESGADLVVGLDRGGDDDAAPVGGVPGSGDVSGLLQTVDQRGG